MSEGAKREVQAGLRVFAYTAAQLKEIVLGHAKSAQECIDELEADMPDEPETSTDVMATGTSFSSQREVFQAAVRSATVIRDEALYLAEHVAPGLHCFTAAELLAFRSAYGPLKIDHEKLKFSPAAATPPDQQAERRQSEVLVAKPRIVLPPGVRL